VRALAKQLAAPLQTLADQLVMNVEILMPSRELELLAREALGESIEVPSSWAGWRADVVVGPMRETVARLADAPC
jgi:ribonuclease D